ncbi:MULTISPECIES: hypothetical protein [Nostocales]|uniref:Uncharacterized protein n=3 Tax=Nostocales TaxID=1161 RepID=A0A0C1RCI6_9CYAN|nr:hypothetical protein [Tolypothrix bouteillei]KAF3887632.1 hypothetical protein DA73_0400020690 [Tolypothrix bouteillei VB521301]
MPTVNGKLITQGHDCLETLDTLKQKTTNTIQNVQTLEAQMMNLSQQQEQKYAQELNTIKNHLNQLDKRCILLEESISRQFVQFIIVSICSSIFGLFCLWYWFGTPHKPKSQTQVGILYITKNFKLSIS